MAIILNKNFMKKIIFALILLTLFTGCTLNQKNEKVIDNTETAEFAVYLADSNQIIFSEKDIASYEPSTKTFTFTLDGARKMKSYQLFTQIYTGLYQKSFIAKFGNEELYRGKFWTGLSSISEFGIIMTDVVMIGPDYNTLTVTGGYPSNQDSDKKINDPRLIEHLKKINKIK